MIRKVLFASAAVVMAGAALYVAVPTAPPATAADATRPVDSLDGTWELLAVIDNGTPVPIDFIRETMIRDARIIVNGQTVTIRRPEGQLHTLAFVTNARTSPKTVDLAGTSTLGSRGILMRDGDTLILCVSGSETAQRPTQFASLPGSDAFLMTFRRIANPPPPAPPAPVVAPVPPAPPAALPEEAEIRRILTGTWGHQTGDEVVRVTLNADGTYSMLTTHQRGMRRIFNREDRTSGTWRVRDAVVTMTPTASSARNTVGQVESFRITSISESEVIYIDNQSGQRRIQWRLR